MPLDISRIKALCFDVDGTLRDTDDHYTRRFARYLSPFRVLLPGRDPQKAARWLVMKLESPGNIIFGIPDRLGIDDNLVRISDFLHARGLLPDKPHDYLVIEGVQETLRTLSEKYPLAVISARPKRGTDAFLSAAGLSGYFQCVASGQTTPYTKPSPDPLYWAAERLGVSPEACLMIGDTTVDILCGKDAGAQTVGVLSGFGEENELVKSGANLILKNVGGLLPLLIPQ